MTYSKSLIGLAALVSASVPAFGQPPIIVEGLPTAIVSYADLDLSNPAGQQALNGRVRRAAEQLCVDNRVRDLARTQTGRACLSFALNHAQGQVQQAIADFGNQQFAARQTITVAGR